MSKHHEFYSFEGIFSQHMIFNLRKLFTYHFITHFTCLNLRDQKFFDLNLEVLTISFESIFSDLHDFSLLVTLFLQQNLSNYFWPFSSQILNIVAFYTRKHNNLLLRLRQGSNKYKIKLLHRH